MAQQQQEPIERLSYTIEESRRASGFSRNLIYAAIARGELRSFKVGKRRLISAQALREYIACRERETEEGRAA